MGLPRGHVLPVKNYENEATQITGVNILLMEALERCLDFADDFMDEQLEKISSEEKWMQVFESDRIWMNDHYMHTTQNMFHFFYEKMLVYYINK